jgi:hypothetical protein
MGCAWKLERLVVVFGNRSADVVELIGISSLFLSGVVALLFSFGQGPIFTHRGFE